MRTTRSSAVSIPTCTPFSIPSSRYAATASTHNATEFGASGLREIELDDQGQLFTADRRGEFLDHLRAKLSDKHPGARAADELIAGKTVPSKQLMSVSVRLLGLEPGGPVTWDPDDRMQLLVADGPQEMESFLDGRRTQGYGARMSAGYCWPWSPEPKPGHPLPPDVVIGDWARPWNLRGERSVSGAPPSALWATDPAGFG